MKIPQSFSLFAILPILFVPGNAFSKSSSSSSASSGSREEYNHKNNHKSKNRPELMLIQSVWRHGDRNPASTFLNDIYQEDFWYQGWGSLTPLGMEQHYVLGRKLRNRYVHQLKFMDGKFHMKEIYVRSTDYNRTLESALSNMVGFFGPGTPGLDSPDIPGWPVQFVPVPVHTINVTQDFIGGTTDPPCPRNNQVRTLLSQSPEVRNLTAKNMPFLNWLSNKTGSTYGDMFSLGGIYNGFFIQKDVNGLRLVDFVENNKTVRPRINAINNQGLRWQFGLDVEPMNGVNFRLELSKMAGGPLLWQMIGNMQAKVSCATSNSSSTSRLCTWANNMKYFVYSAHDSTVMGLFAALGFNRTNYDTDGFVLNSACVTMELWRQNSTTGGQPEFFVKVLYWKPEVQRKVNEPLALDITKDVQGCGGQNSVKQGCPLEQFIQRSEPYKMTPSPFEYCQMPLNLTNASTG